MQLEEPTKNKSVIVLTNFWDADDIFKKGYFLNLSKETKVVRTELNKKHVAYSIALRDPKITFNHLKINGRLDFFCPTWGILTKYKVDRDWSAYRQSYHDLLVERKQRMADWFSSLEDNFVYFLCCWENINKGAHCHRQIIYEALKASKSVNEKVITVLR